MWFKRKKFKFGRMYACYTGDYAGQFLIFIEKDEEKCGFLTVPDMKNLWMDEEKFDLGLDEGIIKYVNRVPKIVRRTSEKKFAENRTQKL